MNYEKFGGELYIFPTGDNLRTSGFLMGAESDEVIVFLHGMGGNFYKWGILQGAREILDRGISLFTFNNRGAEIVKDFKDLEGEHHTLGTAFENFEECTEDISVALDLLEDTGYSRFHLLGHSTGCQKILYYAYKSKDPRISSLIHLAPADDYEIWRNELGEDFLRIVDIANDMISRGEGNKIIWELYEKTGTLWTASRFLSFASRENWEAKMFNYENLEIFSQVKLPTLIFLGNEDPYFLKPIDFYAEKLRNAYKGEKLKLKIVNGGDHSFHGKEKEVFGEIVEFVKSL
ncbi:alpha/beta hydrolase [Euryarchaeota archaeon ex4484_178]|nr:MAG: alpha/beta hydrolase [Euryarchaeota archaeon ex4484_178]